MEYRLIKAADVKTIYRMGKPIFGRRSEYSWDWSEERIGEYLDKSFGFGIVCVDDGEIIGFALTQKDYSTQKPNVAWINYVFVAKKYRLKKIGSELLGKVCSALKKRGKTDLITDVYVKNKSSLHFFESNKFEVKERWLILSRKLH